MNYVLGSVNEIPANTFQRFAEYRYQVFCERLGWNLQTQDGRELDQFDRPDTLYIVAENYSGQVCGCARILPTTRPYLLSEVFPQLFAGQHPPQSEDIWELSRFAAIDTNDRKSMKRQFSASVASQLLWKSMEFAAHKGAQRMISVSPLGVERLIQRAGAKYHRAGPPVIINGQPIFACWIEIE